VARVVPPWTSRWRLALDLPQLSRRAIAAARRAGGVCLAVLICEPPAMRSTEAHNRLAIGLPDLPRRRGRRAWPRRNQADRRIDRLEDKHWIRVDQGPPSLPNHAPRGAPGSWLPRSGSTCQACAGDSQGRRSPRPAVQGAAGQPNVGSPGCHGQAGASADCLPRCCAVP